MKTGELFALSCELGARLTGAGVEEQRALRDYGMALGTAYQIFDDCVDLFGSESQAGKSLGTDLVGGKLTLPLIVAIERLGSARRPGARTPAGPLAAGPTGRAPQRARGDGGAGRIDRVGFCWCRLRGAGGPAAFGRAPGAGGRHGVPGSSNRLARYGGRRLSPRHGCHRTRPAAPHGGGAAGATRRS